MWLYIFLYTTNKNNIDKIFVIYTNNYVRQKSNRNTYYCIIDFGILAFRESLESELGFRPNSRGCNVKRVFIYLECVCAPFIFLTPKTFYLRIDKQTELVNRPDYANVYKK